MLLSRGSLIFSHIVQYLCGNAVKRKALLKPSISSDCGETCVGRDFEKNNRNEICFFVLYKMQGWASFH